ncbi:FHA domain-containing protein [Trichormus variabilis]|uniref:FHA domain-containing protein n=1 Tax=Trichormus variabilis SAG 1403-4b TaxID=447716 RepID=A0A3S1A794_ANAVA|nr:FHA domain-containing protein [Trichormus variabilis]MBD2625013.1 FHA domain-containing protein [Trichormus variabilis FACHB-164]RUS95052.1 hypothetical protein DSM107003_32520 [Trichormus variabilis SAG 1403-4b]
MQNINIVNNIGFNLELVHLQTNTAFELPPNLTVILIGKPHEKSLPDIDVSQLPNADIASRIHAQIQVTGGVYFLEDLGSSNGTFLNNTKLEAKTPYQLNIGDQISLGQGNAITFVFQYQQNQQSGVIKNSSPTSLQPQIPHRSIPTTFDKTNKLIGIALMVAGIVILTANIRVGFFVRFPGIIVCIAGVYILFQKRINHSLGWLLLALGIGVIFFTSNVFASVNLLVIIGSFALFIAGYQLLTTGKILDYDLRSIQNLIKK